MADYYDLSFLRNLTSNFVNFRNAHTKWIEKLEDDEILLEFKNLIQSNVTKSKDEINRCLNDFKDEEKSQEIINICKECELDSTTYGKEIRDLGDKIGEYVDVSTIEFRYYRNLDVQLLRHLNEFFKCDEKHNGSTLKHRVEMWDKLFDLTPEKIFTDFCDIVEKMCEMKYPDVHAKNTENARALGVRCLSLFQGTQSISWISDAKNLEAQLETIHWQHYVPAHATTSNRVVARFSCHKETKYYSGFWARRIRQNKTYLGVS
jgi:hypothetical protein